MDDFKSWELKCNLTSLFYLNKNFDNCWSSKKLTNQLAAEGQLFNLPQNAD